MSKTYRVQKQTIPAHPTINVEQLEARVKKDLSWILVSLSVAVASGLLINFLFF